MACAHRSRAMQTYQDLCKLMALTHILSDARLQTCWRSSEQSRQELSDGPWHMAGALPARMPAHMSTPRSAQRALQTYASTGKLDRYSLASATDACSFFKWIAIPIRIPGARAHYLESSTNIYGCNDTWCSYAMRSVVATNQQACPNVLTSVVSSNHLVVATVIRQVLTSHGYSAPNDCCAIGYAAIVVVVVIYK